MCEVSGCSGSKAFNSKGWQDSEMTSANQIRRKSLLLKRKSRERNVGKKKASRQATSNKQSEGVSRFRDVENKADQEKVASSNKHGGRQKCQGERVPRDHTVNGRDNRAVRLRSYRLSLSL